MSNVTRIRSNIEKMRSKGANEQQINEYVALEQQKSGRMNTTLALAGMVGEAAVKPITQIAPKAGEAAVSTAQEIIRNPVRTAGEVAGGVGGFALGSLATPIVGVGTAALGSASAGQVGESIDNYLFGRESRSASDRLTSAGVTAATSALGPVAIGFGKRLVGSTAGQTATEQQVSAKVAELTKGSETYKSFKRLFGKDADKYAVAAEQTVDLAKPLGVEGARNIVASDRALATGLITKTSDAAKVFKQRDEFLQTKLGGPAKGANSARLVSNVAEKAAKNVDKLRKAQFETNVVFSGSRKVPSGITGGDLRAIVQDPVVAGNIKATPGGADTVERLNKILPSITAQGERGRATRNVLSEADAGTALSKFITEMTADPQRAALFWGTVYEQRLKPLLESANTSFSANMLKQFEQRFALSKTGSTLGEKLTKADPSFVTEALSSPQSWQVAEEVWKKAATGSNFKDYARAVMLSAARGEDGALSATKTAALLNRLDPNTVDKAISKGFYEQLKDINTVLQASSKMGVEEAVKGASMGQVSGKSVAELSREAGSAIAIGTLAPGSQALGIGARTASLGNALFGRALGRATTVQQAGIEKLAREAITGQSARDTYPAYVALAQGLGAPVVSAQVYEEQVRQLKESEAGIEERRGTPQVAPKPLPRFNLQEELSKIESGETPASGFNLQEELRKIEAGGQGGPDEIAPSMGGRTADELGKLIEQTTAQDDMNQLVQQVSDQDEFDQLVRKAMREEEPKVLRAVGTKEEEGFRTRVYRDTVGKRTIGIGFNMDAPGARDRWTKAGVKTDFNDALNGRKTITKQEAESLYALVKGETEVQARKLVRNYTTLGKHQQSALKDMVYQLGAAGAMAFVRTRALIEKGDFSGAARALLDSRNAEQSPARVKRRAYMLQYNVPMVEADAALVKTGDIPRSQSINTPQELSRLLGETKVATAKGKEPSRG